MAAKISFLPIFGEPTPLADQPFSEYITAWLSYLDGDINHNFPMPNVQPPHHFEAYHASLVKLCAEATSESKMESKAEAQRVLALLGYYHVLLDFKGCEEELLWKKIIPSGCQWSILRAGSATNTRRLLFDVQLTSEQLGSRLKSGETIVLFYFGHSDRHTGDWFIEDDWMNTNDSNLRGMIEHPFRRLLSKFVGYLAARLQTGSPLEDISLVIVSDSCSSGALCEQLQQFNQEEIVCGLHHLKVSNVLEACKCAVAVQASCASGNFAYSRYFTPLFTALQREEKFEFFSDIKCMLDIQVSSSRKDDFEFVESPSLHYIRPVQTPKNSVIGPQHCISRLRQQIQFFDSDDARSLRVFWEYYGSGIAGLDFEDKLLSVSYVRSRNQSVSGDQYTMDVTSASEAEAGQTTSGGDTVKDMLLHGTWPVDDAIAYRAGGDDSYGFIALVTVGDKQQKFALHLYCTPTVEVVTNTETDSDVEILRFKPCVGTTYNFAEAERLFKDYKGVAFRVSAASEEDARQELQRLRHLQFDSSEILDVLERLSRKGEKMFVFTTKPEVGDRFSDWFKETQPWQRVNAKVTVFAYPYRAAYSECEVRPLIEAASELTAREQMWLQAMLDNVQEFLREHSDAVVYVYDQHGNGKVVSMRVSDWLKRVTNFFQNTRPGPTYEQFRMHGSVCSTFSALGPYITENVERLARGVHESAFTRTRRTCLNRTLDAAHVGTRIGFTM